MRLLQLLSLAVKYLRRYFRRYIFLLMALTFGFAIITVITSLQDGMYKAVYNAAQGHYAGDLFVLGVDKDSDTKFRVSRVEPVLEAVEETGLQPTRVVRRTQFGNEGLVYFNGTAVRHKYVFGVDWNNEQEYFQSLNYSAGGPEELSESTRDIMLSKPVADELAARVGDRVLLEVSTRTGQKNTGHFIVRGIVDSTNIFGYYKCYISRENLNRLLRYGPEECSTIGIYLPRRSNLEQKALRLQQGLEDRVALGPLIKDRHDANVQYSKSWDGIRHFVLTLRTYLSEVADLLAAINMVGYFLYVMMILIVLASIFVTYELILHERAREIGTMRSLGFYAEDIQLVLVLESVLLFAVSMVLGFVIARAAVWGISFLSFSWIPSFDIFMQNGRLQAEFYLRTILINIGIMLLILIPAVWVPAWRISLRDLPEVLSGGNR
jgi:ABC-type lipoprotein release transport system permease subunit